MNANDMSLKLCLFLIFSALALGDIDKHKRILLHDDQDFVAEFVKLRATVFDLQNENQQLKTKQQQLETQQLDLQTKQRQLQSAIDQITIATNDVSGSTYVRWGRKVCPDHAERVYKGYTSGKRYNDPGSGTDNLCLPDDPLWGHYHDGADDLRGFIYGTEVDHRDNDGIFPNPINEQDMPCAVCRTNKTVTLMIAARTACYPGWTVEYTGNLMSGVTGSSYFAYDHLCLDGDPEYLAHGGTNDNQHILFNVEAKCGSLPCPPYVEGRELACVVCSK